MGNKITKNHEFKKGVGIDSTIESTETKILLPQFSLQKFNPYFLAHYIITYFAVNLCQKVGIKLL